MARAEYIFETNSVNGGFLVDRRTDQIVGTTSRGVDRYFVNGETNQLTGGSVLTTGGAPISIAGFRKSEKVAGHPNKYLSGLSNGTDTGCNVRIPVKFTEDVYDLRVVLSGVYGVDELDVPNSYTDVVVLEYPSGTIYKKFTFSGNPTATVYGGSSVSSDTVGIFIPAGATAYIRHYVAVTSGNKWPTGLINSVVPYPGIGNTQGTTQTDQSSTIGFSYGTGYAYIFNHQAILAKPVSNTQFSVIGAYGDSILAGSGSSLFPTEGWLGLATRDKNSVLNMAMGGDSAASQSGKKSAFRLSFLSYVDYVVEGFGANDISGADVTLLQLQNLVIAVWTALKLRGKKIYRVTITPSTTSSDLWATTANQTVLNNNYAVGGTRVQFNNWLRSGAPISASALGVISAASIDTVGAVFVGDINHPVIGIVDVATAVESGFNSCLWKANGTNNWMTSDGRHPNDAAVTMMAACWPL